MLVRKNSGGNVGDAYRLNLIEGDGINLTVAADNAFGEVDVTIANGGSIAPRLVVPRVVTPPPTIITTFQSGHGYTVAGGTATLNDTTSGNYILGSQGVTITTSGSGGSGSYIRKFGSPAIDATGKIPAVVFKVDDWANVASIFVTFGDTSLANNWRAPVKDDLYTSQNQMIFRNGEWGVVTIPWDNLLAATGTPTRSSITDFQVQVVDKGTGTGVTVHVNGIYFINEPSLYPNGVVSVTFDDGYVSQYTEGRKKLDQYGFGASAYVIVDALGDAGGAYMTLAELHELEDSHGWEIGGHAYAQAVHNPGLPNVTLAAASADIYAQRRWLLQEGFRGADHFAYPGGQYNSDIETVIKQNYASARTINSSYSESLVPCRAHRLRPKGYMSSSVTTATATGYIDNAYTNKSWLILTFHKLVTSGASGSDYTIANFGTIVDYLATKGIPVKPVGAVLRSLAGTVS